MTFFDEENEKPSNDEKGNIMVYSKYANINANIVINEVQLEEVNQLKCIGSTLKIGTYELAMKIRLQSASSGKTKYDITGVSSRNNIDCTYIYNY